MTGVLTCALPISMADYYHNQWLKARLTEGASQRVQEDTLKFARIMEGLGTGLLDSVMTLIAFTPILWGLSKQIDVLPWIGEVDHALVWVAIISALGGTLLLAAVGIKLPGIEYDIQKEEAGYRKELVHGEDDPIRAAPPTIGQLYNRVRGIHYKSYSIPTSLNIKPSTIKKTVPPIVQINAPTINPYSHSPKKKIGIPTLKPNKMGINCIKIIIDSIKLVPNPSIILVNLIVSS